MNEFSRWPALPFMRLSSASSIIQCDAIMVVPRTSPYSCISPQTRWPQRTSAGDPAHRSIRRCWPCASRLSPIAPTTAASVALTSPWPSPHPSQPHRTIHRRLRRCCIVVRIAVHPSHHRALVLSSCEETARVPKDLCRLVMRGQARVPGARAARARRMRCARPRATGPPRRPELPHRRGGPGTGCR